MGAALLSKPEKIKEILTSLVHGLTKPVSCKMRILNSVHLFLIWPVMFYILSIDSIQWFALQIEDTVNLAKLVESCGVVALAIHGRTKEERPRHRNKPEYIKAVVKTINIPVIAKYLHFIYRFQIVYEK